jgi:hypothetical protein
MALGTTINFQIRTDGNNANGGGFNASGASPGTDRTQQASPHVTIDGATITAVVHSTTTQLNVTGYTVSAADNRNTVNIGGGTATAGLYEITAVDGPNNRWTLDRAAGTAAQTATGRMGGAFADPGYALQFQAASSGSRGMAFYVQAGTYLITSTTINVAGGRLAMNSNGLRLIGHGTGGRGDRTATPIIRASGISGVALLTNSSSGAATDGALADNFELDGNSLATMTGLLIASRAMTARRITVYGCVNGMNNSGGNQCWFWDCVFRNNSQDGASGNSCMYIRCFSRNNGRFGFVSASGNFFECSALSNASHGFSDSNGGGSFRRCASVSNAGSGFFLARAATADFSIAYGNSSWGFNVDSSGSALRNVYIANCAGGANTSGNVSSFNDDSDNLVGFVTLSASPFVNSAAYDFALTGAGQTAISQPAFTLPGTTTATVDRAGVWRSAGGGVLLPRPMNGGYSA